VSGLASRATSALLCAALCGGCAYRMGSGITAGALDELSGTGRSKGANGVGDAMLERALLADLGHQLGQGLASGATDISDEQRAQLEATIDAVLFTAAQRTGKGLRTEVSPALREMVRRDIVDALADGMRNEVGASLEDVVDRVVSRAVQSLKEGLQDPELTVALSDMIRESVYFAMEEGRPGVASVADTLAFTLQHAVLTPMEASVTGMSDNVALKVEEASKRTENTLRAVIAFLGLVLAGVGVAYSFTRRQLVKERDHARETQHELETVGAALNLLDDSTRTDILGKLDQYRQGARAIQEKSPTVPPPPARSSAYTRRRPRKDDDSDS
jgi:Arc/MetJ family transcription regulator